MSYQKLKEKRQGIRSKLGEAKAELVELESEKGDLFKSLEEIEQQKINEAAKVKVGKGSSKAAKDAKDKYSSMKSNLDEVRTNIAVSERAIQILEQERSEIESQFQNEARKKWRDVAGKHIDNIHDLMQKIQNEIDQLNGYRKSMQPDNIQYPERSFFKGIGHHSQPVISTKRLGQDAQNFITTNNLKSE